MYKLAAACSLLVAGADAHTRDYEAMWTAFKVEHGKAYDSNGAEADRFQIFKANVDKIDEHNAKQLSYTLGINQFADLTADEFAVLHLGGYRPDLRKRSGTPKVQVQSVTDVPDAVDWVDKGGVTGVKNQGSCGSCWAFSTTGAIEGAYFAASGKLISLSEEDLVQCDHNDDQGCQGGLMDNAFDWVKENGICAEEAYPYSSGGGTTGTCRTPACQPVLKVGGHVDVPAQDEDALKAAVAGQPVSVAIEADRMAFQLYRGGVLDSSYCGKTLDHGVLVVGYGTDGGKDYWKVKNSWGGNWGEEGYLRMARGKDMCGISQQPSYPTNIEPISPGPSPPSPGPGPANPHYADPKDGCQSDEKAVQVEGVSGGFCSSKCFPLVEPCPTDVPEGVTATPQCLLKESMLTRYCALQCQPQGDDDQCGKTASCKEVQTGVGICTYDDDLAKGLVAQGTLTRLNNAEQEMVV